MRILVVEDDKSIADAIAGVLTKKHYTVDVAADGQTGWDFAVAYDYDLILLDVMLPKLDGISLCQQLRREEYKMPILLLTARDSGTDKVMGLDAGADDYVVKPFDFQELTARIRALLRRGNSTLPPVLEWGSLRLDPSNCEVTFGSQALHLTPKEYGLLELFLRNSNRVFSRSAIIDNLWVLEDPPEEDTIKSHIKSLRQKLKAAGAPNDSIETVYGLGYRLKPLSHKQKCHTLQPTEPETSWAEQQTMLAVVKAREDFKTGINDRLAVIEQATKALNKSKLSNELRSRAEQEAHKLAGSLGSFGFAEGSRLAQEIEQMLQTENCLEQAQSLHLCELVTQLHREIVTPAEPTFVEPVASEQHPRLLIVSDDIQLIEQLAKEATMRKMQLETAIDPVSANSKFVENTLGAIASAKPDVVLLDLCVFDGTKNRLQLLAELSAQMPLIPIVVLTDRNTFTDRVEVARHGGHSFLPKSMPPHQVLELVNQVLQRHHVTKAKVLVVDDDPQMLTVIKKSLEPWGIKLKIIEDPRLFWDSLTEFSPNLLILDVTMPHLNGIELCKVVRNDPCWSKLPVMFLTAHVTADTVDQIFAAGADDCVSKPIVGTKLIDRIFNCLERTQLFCRMVETEA